MTPTLSLANFRGDRTNRRSDYGCSKPLKTTRKVPIFKLKHSLLCAPLYTSSSAFSWRCSIYFFKAILLNVEEVLYNLTMSENQIHFPLHMSNRFEGTSLNVKPDSLAYNEERSAVWAFPLSSFLINQAFTSFQLSDSVLHPSFWQGVQHQPPGRPAMALLSLHSLRLPEEKAD